MTLRTKQEILNYISANLSDSTSDQAKVANVLNFIQESNIGCPESPIEVTGALTLSEIHYGRDLIVTAAATITLPEDATEALPDGFFANVKRRTASVVGFAVEGTDVVESIGGGTAIANENGWVTAKKDESGVWSLIGDL